jgi:sporulation protein YqfC
MSGAVRGLRFPPRADWPPDVLADLPRITLVGAVELLLENHQGLESFSDDELRVATREGWLQISGSDLTIASLGPIEIRVTGRIRAVAFVAPPDTGT